MPIACMLRARKPSNPHRNLYSLLDRQEISVLQIDCALAIPLVMIAAASCQISHKLLSRVPKAMANRHHK